MLFMESIKKVCYKIEHLDLLSELLRIGFSATQGRSNS